MLQVRADGEADPCPVCLEPIEEAHAAMRCCGAGGKRCGATAGQLESKRNEMECNALFRLFSFFSRRAATCGSVRVPVHAVGVTAERGAGRHYFHAECLARWAERSTACPVCRCRVEVSGVATVMQQQLLQQVALPCALDGAGGLSSGPMSR